MNHTKILVIDDEFPVRYLIENQLRLQGYEVDLAKNGISGLEAAQVHKPDLIVLDVMMPDMNGFEVCQKIKKDPEISSTPIVFLTAYMNQENEARAFSVGAHGFLAKPFHLDDLLSHIEAALQRSNRAPTQETIKSDEPQTTDPRTSSGRIIALFSPKGGVGTTTLAIQLSEAMAVRQEQPVVLIDLDLPLGGVAPMLDLHSERDVLDLLNYPTEHITHTLIKQFMYKYRANLSVIPAPANLMETEDKLMPFQVKHLLDILVTAGYQVILDLGSTLTSPVLTALRQADVAFVITSGQPVANKLYDAFMATADRLGLEPQRLLPVVNELHGATDNVKLARVPVARLPQVNESSPTSLSLKEQGIQKLVSVML